MRRVIVTGAAGTGKTYLLLENLLNLPERDKALVLTSSSRMANEIRTRFRDASGSSVSSVTVHTVRSLCEAALRENEPEIQIMSDFRAWFALQECIRSESAPLRSSYAHIKDKHSFTSEMLELIEAASINSISIDQLPGADQEASKLADIKNIYKYYRNYCHQNGLIPPFDVISRASGLLSKYCERFNYIFMDQYEDLCPGEVSAVNSLVSDSTSITIFMDAVRSEPEADKAEDTKRLDGTYRRLPAGMSGHVNRLLGKEIYPASEQDGRAPEEGSQSLTIVIEETGIDEAEYIARTIRKEVSRPGRKYSDFAILCRDIQVFGKTMRDTLRKYSIPCSGGMDVSHDPLVRFMLLSLQVIADPHEDDAVLKWLSSPIARLDRADVYRAYSSAKRERQELYNIIVKEAHSEAASLFQKSGSRLREIISILDSARDEFQNGQKVEKLVSLLLERSDAFDALPEGEAPRAVVLLLEMIQDIEMTYEVSPGLLDILNDIKAGLTHISESESLMDEDSDSVVIMSISESRGLEFPFVFVPGMVSDFFPARHPARQLLYGEDLDPARTVLRDVDLPGTIDPARWREQERHLLYIAMTRAMERLYLTFACRYPDRENCEPSPFLVDLLDGKEVSADSCAHFGIVYQDRPISSMPVGMPSPDDIASRADLEGAFCQYIRELEHLNRERAARVVELLSSKGMINDPLPLPAKEIAIPRVSSRRFSHTAIRNYLSCPRRYFLSYLLRVDSEDRASAHFGKLVHDTLREFHRQYPELHIYDLEELSREMNRILSEIWKDMQASFAGNRLQARSYQRLAVEVLQAYLQGEHSRWDENRSCASTEWDFNLSLFDKYRLTGRIDRIDACASGGNEIMDFKTSAYDTDGEVALKSEFLNVDDDPDYKPRDFQLPIYYFAGLNENDLDPQRLVIYQLRNFRSSGTPFRREIDILPNDDTRSGKKDKFLTKADLESVREDILRTLDRMASGFYPPEPRDDSVCENECDFSFLCDREENSGRI